MRFTYAEAMCDPAQLAPLAKAAEESGYHAFTVPDSICYPKHSDTEYPYNDDGTREFLEGKPFIDPFCLMSTLGAHTSRLRFSTFVIKLPIRQPVLVATAQQEEAPGVVLCDGQELTWHPAAELQRPLGPSEVYSLYKGLRLMASFGG